MKARKNPFLRTATTVTAVALCLMPSSLLGDNTWSGGGTTTNWSDAGNWTGGAITSGYFGTLDFNSGGSVGTTSNNDVTGVNGNLLRWTGTSPWTLGGSSISLFDNGGVQAKIENQSTGLVTINAPILFAATAGTTRGEINAVNGDITFGSTATVGITGSAVAGLEFFGNGRTVTLGGIISGSGKYLALRGTGANTAGNTVILNAANTYTGDTFIDTGTFVGGNSSAFGTAGIVYVGNGGSTFGNTNAAVLLSTAGVNISRNLVTNKADNSGSAGTGTRTIGGSNTTGTTTFSGSIFLNGGAVLTSATGGTNAFTGVIQNGTDTGVVSRAVTINGSGTTSLSGANTYSGGTTVNGGTLKIGISSTGTVTNGATGTGNVTFNNTATLSNSNGITWLVPTLSLNGTLNITGNNRLSISFATLELNAGSRTINVNSKSSALTGGNTLATGETTGLWSWETGSTLGTPNVQNGTLNLQTSAFSGSNYGMFFMRGTNFSNADVVVGSNVVLGLAGNFGTSSSNTANVTIQSGGIMNLTNGGRSIGLLGGAGTVFNTMSTGSAPALSTLSLIGTSGSQTFSGVLANGPRGALGLTKSGAGSTQILSGTNTYSGSTLVSGGTLQLGSSSALGTPSSSSAIRYAAVNVGTGPNTTTVSTGAVLDLGGQTVTNERIIISGTGLINTGALINSSSSEAFIGGTGLNLVSLTESGTWTTGTLSAVPAVSATGGGGTGFAATALVGVRTFGSITGGSGYGTTAVTVTISGGGGTGATATATVTSGVVTGLTLTNPGTGYTSLPTISITGAGSGASSSIASLGVTGLQVTNFGTGYTSAPTISIDTTGWTTNATASATVPSLDLAAAASIGGTGNITISLPVTGANALTKVGNNTLTLSNSNTYSGTTTISGGTLQLGNGNATGSLSTSSAIVNDGVLAINRSNTVTQGTAFNALISGSGALLQNGTSASTLVLSGNNSYTGLTTISGGTLRLGAAGVGANTPLGTNASGTVVSGSGAALDLNGFTLVTAEALTLNGTGISSAGALTNASGTAATYSGLVTLGSASSIIASGGNITVSNVGTITGSGFGLTVGGAANTSITSIIGTGSGSVTKQDAGTLTLSGANTFTGGVNAQGGTLQVGVSSNFASGNGATGNPNNGNLTLGNGVTVQAATGISIAAPTINLGGNVTIGNTTATGRMSFTGTWDLGGSSRTITLGKSSGATPFLAGSEVMQFERITGGSDAVIENAGASGSLAFASAASATAAQPSVVAINSAAAGFANNTGLTLGDGVAMKSRTGSFFATGTNAPALSLAADAGKGGGVLQMGDGINGGNAVTRSAVVYSLSGSGTVTASNTTGTTTTGTLTINNGNGADFGGSITDGGGTGVIALVKSGSGTQILSGTNSYTGATTISGGTLIMGDSAADTFGTTSVSVAGTATLGGSGIITPTGANGISVASTGKLAPGVVDGIGTLTMDLGSTTGGLAMASGSIFDWQLSGSGGTSDQVNFWNYNSGDLALNNNAVNLKLTGAEAAGTYTATLFKFYGDGGTTLAASGLTTGLSIGSLTGSFSGTPTFDYNTAGEIRLSYSVVPEPSSALAGLLIAAGLLRRRRSA